MAHCHSGLLLWPLPTQIRINGHDVERDMCLSSNQTTHFWESPLLNGRAHAKCSYVAAVVSTLQMWKRSLGKSKTWFEFAQKSSNKAVFQTSKSLTPVSIFSFESLLSV